MSTAKELRVLLDDLPENLPGAYEIKLLDKTEYINATKTLNAKYTSEGAYLISTAAKLANSLTKATGIYWTTVCTLKVNGVRMWSYTNRYDPRVASKAKIPY